MNLKFAPYSKSRLDASDCPWAFANEYIGRDWEANGYNDNYIRDKYKNLNFELIKRPKQDQINLLFGEVVHEILEDIINHRWEGKDLNGEILTSIINRHMKEQIIHGPDGFNYITVQNIVDRFMKTYDYDHEFLVGVEVPLGIDYEGKTCEYNDPQCYLRMKADVLEMSLKAKTARLTDHKSQLLITDPQDSFQIAEYATIIFKNYPLIESIVVRLNFCRYGKYEEAVYTRDDVLRIEAAVKAKIDSIEARTDFTQARRCGYCNVCAYRTNACPLLAQEANMEIRTPTTNEEAKKLFEMLIGIETKRDEIKDKIKTWCSVNSATISVPVDVDNTEPKNKCSDILCIGFRETESIKYPLRETVDLLTRYNLNVNQYLLTNRDALDRIIETKKAAKELFKDPDTAEQFKKELASVQEKTPGVRFDRFKTNLMHKPK